MPKNIMNKITILFFMMLFTSLTTKAIEIVDTDNITVNLEKIEQEIELQEKELANTEDSKIRISKNISILEDKLLYLRQTIGQLDIKYKELQKEFKNTEQKAQMIKNNVQLLENEIKKNNIYILENFQMLKVKALILTDNYHQILKNLDIVEYINLMTHKKILEYKHAKEDYEKTLKDLDMAKKRLINTKNKRDLLAENYENEQIRYKHILAMLNEDTTLKKAYIETLKKKRNEFEKKFKHIHLKTPVATSKSIEEMKGKLPWPIKGEIVKNNNKSPQNSIYNNGIKILSKNDENVKAVFNGVIQYINWIKGYGNIVIIAHDNNYFTVYANLDLTGVQLNEPIKTGETIGKINIEGTVSNPYIYFEIRKKDKALNPLDWLKKEA